MKITKNKKIVIIISAVFVLLFLLIIWFIGIDGNKKYNAEIKIKDSNVSNDEIAKKLINKHLSHFKSLSVNYNDRLENYRIKEVKTSSGNNEPEITANGGLGFVFNVVFSFKSFYSKSDLCITANGTEGKNGWIENECWYVIVVKHGDTYKIESIGTGP